MLIFHRGKSMYYIKDNLIYTVFDYNTEYQQSYPITVLI